MNRRQACLSPMAVAASIPAGFAVPARAAGGEPQRRRLRFALTFSNPLPRALGPQVFWGYLPASTVGGQRLLDLQVSMDFKRHTDALSQQILELRFNGFPAHARRVVTLSVEVALSAGPIVEPLPQHGHWLGAERYLELDDPGIRALAGELKRATPWDTARSIYEWVSGNIHYAGYVADELGAARALQERRGDCTEYADLAVALARSCGLPARTLGGFVADRDMAPRAADYHNWAEFHLDGAWRLVDCQKRNWLSPAEQYVVFRVHTETAANPIGHAHRYRVEGEVEVSL